MLLQKETEKVGVQSVYVEYAEWLKIYVRNNRNTFINREMKKNTRYQ